MRDYDQRTTDCESCYWLQDDAFPDGRPYQACRWRGYILHDNKPISEEPCKDKMTRTQGLQYMELQRAKTERRKKR